MTEDAALLRRFADECDQAAFAALVRRHVDAVYSSALRRVGGDTHLAEDVTQQVFIALAHRARLAARHPALTAWLYVATRHATANAVRTERRRKIRERLAATMHDSTPDPAASIDWSRVAPLLDTEIDRLGERDRTALLLRFLENRRYADIAAALALTEDAARRRVDRALEKLRLALARRGLTSTAAALALVLSQHAVSAAPAALSFSAVSAAASNAPAALTFLQLMTTTKICATTLAAAALLVVSLGTATSKIICAHSATAALLAARAKDSALATRLRALDDRVDAAERVGAALAEKLNSASAAASSSATARTSGLSTGSVQSAPTDPVAAGTAFLQRHPSVRQALVDWLDGQTNYKYSAFYAQAGLNQEQIAQFLALNRHGWLSRSLGPASPPLQFQLSPLDSWREADAQLRAFLGPDKSRQYNEYLGTLPARDLSAQLASSLAFSTAPLTAAQFDQLTANLVSSHAVEITRTGPAYDWTRINQSAAALSLTQRAALAGIKAKAEFDAAYSRAASATP